MNGDSIQISDIHVESAERAKELLQIGKRTYRSNFAQGWLLVHQGLELAKSSENPIVIINGLCTYAELLRYKGKFQEALDSISDAQSYLGTLVSPNEEEALVAGMRGGILYSKGKLTEASASLINAILIYRQLRHYSGIIRISITLGAIYSHFWMYSAAMEHYLEALLYIDCTEKGSHHAALYSAVGNLYLELYDYEEALHYHQLAYTTYQEVGNYVDVAGTLLNIGVVYEEQKIWEKSLEHYLQALSIARTYSMPMLPILLANIGTIYEYKEQYNIALEYLTEAFELAKTQQSHESLYSILRCLGRLHIKLEQFDKAKEYLFQGLHGAEQLSHVDTQYQVHGELVQYYSNINDAVSALKHKNKQEELIISTQREKALGKIIRIATKQELQRMYAQQQLLAERVSMLEQENNRQSQELTSLTLRATHKQDVFVRLKKMTDTTDSSNHTELIGLLRTIISSEVNNGGIDGWRQFEAAFSGLHPAFIITLTQRFPTLTPTEIKLATLLRIGITTKEVTDILCISLHTANTHRRRLRRKLGLSESVNLVSFLIAL